MHSPSFIPSASTGLGVGRFVGLPLGRFVGLPLGFELVGRLLGLPLGQAAALARSCDLVIGNDTGLLNLAAATGVPSIGLFGGSPPLPQYPCLAALEPAGGATYRVDRMAAIGVETVMAAAERRLRPSAGR